MRTIRYKQIAEEIRSAILGGELAAGTLLPSEASLGVDHGVSRVTIRKALEVLRDEGLIESRQGYGWMVSSVPVAQSLATLVSIERQLADSGRSSERKILDFQFLDAPSKLAGLLGDRVLEVRRLNRADGEPFARVTVWCREDLGANVSKADVTRASFYELLPGMAERASQTIGAELAEAADAALLEVPKNSAMLMVRRTSYGANGRAVLMSEHAFPGHLTQFVAELTRVDAVADEPPAGFRLVDEA